MKNVKISGIRKFYNEVQKVDGAISLTLGQPDFELPKAIKDGLIKAINENKILIWDEPENHLHPEWQIKITQLFVEIAKAGVPILISSHSPYFIQGVRYFTEDVTKDLNQIFVKLAQPMNEIINIENLYRNYSHT